LAEIFGFETRNKYSIETESGEAIGFAAEQQKGFLGFLLRQFLGHWRRFHFTIFDRERTPVLHAEHPFRFFFQRMELYTRAPGQGGASIGAIQQRFAFFSKRFDLQDADGRVILRVHSPFFRFWTFPVYRDHGGQTREVARISKKWGGLLREAFTDADRFAVEFLDSALPENERLLLLAAGIFTDLQYFERKAGASWSMGD
jgi:uncharacterized protein YxjI